LWSIRQYVSYMLHDQIISANVALHDMVVHECKCYAMWKRVG